MPPNTLLLLDKNVVRKSAIGLQRLVYDEAPGREERLALTIIELASQMNVLIYTTTEAMNLLRLHQSIEGVALLLERLRELRRGKYLKRWARRLREHGFTGEDAKVLSYASFGIATDIGRVGVETLITFDLPLIHHYYHELSVLQTRFRRMVSQFKSPYREATLPQVAHPEAVLTHWIQTVQS